MYFLLYGCCFLTSVIIFSKKKPWPNLISWKPKKKYYQEQIEKAKAELTDLQNDPAALEKFARERYLMKRDGEDVYIIEDSLTATK